jgi:hypothetical protein
MKNRILIFIIFFALFSCKKENNIISAQNKNVTIDSVKTLILPIDSKSFVYDKKDKQGYFIYGNTFKKNKYSYSLSRIYGKIALSNDIDLVIIERKPNDDEYTEPIVTLYSYKKNTTKKADSLNIYETISGEGKLTKRFLIDKQGNVNIYENSSGYDFDDNSKEVLIKEVHYSLYKIKPDGKFILIKKDDIEDNKGINPAKSPKWEGTYHFEGSNKDDAKTIFNITINSLNDISVDVNEHGIENKYPHIKAEEVNNEKIKINYDPPSGDMGTIYVEKSDNEFFISGQPIYFINPGNNEMPLNKLK